jgi:hypothetical protein
MIVIEIQSSHVKVIPTKRGQMRKQQAYAHTFQRNGQPNKYPVPAEVIVPDDAQPFAPGHYTLAPQSIYTDQYGQLKLSPVLVPAER